MPLISIFSGISSVARSLMFCQSSHLHLHPYFVYESIEGSGADSHESSLLSDAKGIEISYTGLYAGCCNLVEEQLEV